MVSETVKDRSIKELGEILRSDGDEFRRKVTFRENTAEPNLPPINRTGQPKTQWANTTMERVWDKLHLHERTNNSVSTAFNPKDDEHLQIILDCAQMKEI